MGSRQSKAKVLIGRSRYQNRKKQNSKLAGNESTHTHTHTHTLSLSLSLPLIHSELLCPYPGPIFFSFFSSNFPQNMTENRRSPSPHPIKLDSSQLQPKNPGNIIIIIIIVADQSDKQNIQESVYDKQTYVCMYVSIYLYFQYAGTPIHQK